MSMAQAYFLGTGFATEMPGPLTGYITTKRPAPARFATAGTIYSARISALVSGLQTKTERRFYGAPGSIAPEKPRRTKTCIR